jgi:hypothetical protein
MLEGVSIIACRLNEPIVLESSYGVLCFRDRIENSKLRVRNSYSSGSHSSFCACWKMHVEQLSVSGIDT